MLITGIFQEDEQAANFECFHGSQNKGDGENQIVKL